MLLILLKTFSWNSHLPEEYTPLCECFSNISMEENLPPCQLTIMVFLHLKLFYHKNIYLCVSVFQFFIEEYLSLYELKTLSNWSIYTCVRVFFNFFCWRIPLCELTLMVLPSLEYVFYLNNIHLCTGWLKQCFLHLKKKLSKKYTPLCELTKMTFSTLKMFSTWRIYTSVQACFNFPM